MRVWIDLANSPHPLLFAPIARRLDAEGHEMLMTARDNAQTVELARETWPTVEIIGTASPKARTRKAIVMRERVRDLARWARAAGAQVALSHNSYGQIVAARQLRLPIVTAMDFEHQPANHLAFRLADTILLPEALQGYSLRRQGAATKKVRFYPGLKEEIYLGDFRPNESLFQELGVQRSPRTPIVVLRTPPSRAAYHRFDNPLFREVLEAIGQEQNARSVVLVRHPEQRLAIQALDLPNCTVLSRAINSRSLMWAADLVIGAGGTMTREAALLGVPTCSVFAGTEPAVDRWLRERGSLRRLIGIDGLPPIRCREQPAASLEDLRQRSEILIDCFAEAVASACQPLRARKRQPATAS